MVTGRCMPSAPCPSRNCTPASTVATEGSEESMLTRTSVVGVVSSMSTKVPIPFFCTSTEARENWNPGNARTCTSPDSIPT
eukprot:1735379-Rhodomonas_salina.1